MGGRFEHCSSSMLIPRLPDLVQLCPDNMNANLHLIPNFQNILYRHMSRSNIVSIANSRNSKKFELLEIIIQAKWYFFENTLFEQHSDGSFV